MSVKIVTVSTKKVIDSNDNIIYEFPGDTLLDNILPDLWPSIISYQHCNHPFKIGKKNTQYTGYRVIYDEECDTKQFSKLFIEYYEKNNGLYSLDNIYTARNYLCNWSHLMVGGGDNNHSYLSCEFVKKSELVQFIKLGDKKIMTDFTDIRGDKGTDSSDVEAYWSSTIIRLFIAEGIILV